MHAHVRSCTVYMLSLHTEVSSTLNLYSDPHPLHSSNLMRQRPEFSLGLGWFVDIKTIYYFLLKLVSLYTL